MMQIFDIETIAFTILSYRVSYVELIGTLFGLLSVWLAAKPHIFTWPTGIVNELFLFILFFQVQLYADMFLQVYFFIITIIGWYNWRRATVADKIFTLTCKARWLSVVTLVAGSVLLGFFFLNIHHWFPDYFALPAAYPFIDSFIMVASIIANILLAQKKIETWLIWILVDVVSTTLYAAKGIYFLSLEYFIFLLIALRGWHNWRKEVVL